MAHLLPDLQRLEQYIPPRTKERTPMEKNPVEIGYPPGTQPTPAEVQEANRSIRRLRPAVDATRAEVARAAGAIRDTLGSTASTVRSSAQDRAAELVAYTRQRPATALMMATGLGLLAGVSLVAMGSRSTIGGPGGPPAPRQPPLGRRESPDGP